MSDLGLNRPRLAPNGLNISQNVLQTDLNKHQIDPISCKSEPIGAEIGELGSVALSICIYLFTNSKPDEVS